MEILLRMLMKLFPDNWVLMLNEQSLDEMDKRGLLIWADEIDTQNRMNHESP